MWYQIREKTKRVCRLFEHVVFGHRMTLVACDRSMARSHEPNGIDIYKRPPR